jgi:hypothetical protein
MDCHCVAFLFFAYTNNLFRLYASPPVVSVYIWAEEFTRKVLKLPPVSSIQEKLDDFVARLGPALEPERHQHAAKEVLEVFQVQNLWGSS